MDREILPLEAALGVSWSPATWCDLSVLIAVSGGADSVAIACALSILRSNIGGAGRLIVAHFNHRLRPEADADAEFVKSLATTLGLQFELGSTDVAQTATKDGDGIESAARKARYAFLLQTAERLGARYVVTAHTADDQVETVLFNVLRGTGLNGLAGIPRARSLSKAVSVIRPFLAVRRTEILKYLESIKQEFRIDSTNKCQDFTRNQLRHELLPFLREKYRFDVDNSLLRLANIADESQELIEHLAAELLSQCLMPRNGDLNVTICLNTRPLQNQNRHLVREMFVTLWRQQNWPLQSMGFETWNELAKLAQATASNQQGAAQSTYPGNIKAERHGDQLLLTRIQ